MTEDIPTTPSSIAVKNRLDLDLNPRHLAMGETWARAFSDHPLTDAERQAVAREYAQLLAQPRTQVFHHEVDDRTVVLAQLGQELQVVDQGQLWSWSLEDHFPSDQPRALTVDTLWQAHLSHLETQAGVWKEGSWLLHSFCQAAHTLAKSWAEQDLRLAFRHAGVNGGPGSYCPEPNDPLKMRLIKGYSARTRFYLACIGTALRPLREALPREVRRTLWSIRCPKGWLAHWVLSAPTAQAVVYRCQALRVQPLLLPQAVYGQIRPDFLHPDAWTFGTEPLSHSASISETAQTFAHLEACVDQGRPFQDALLAILDATAPPLPPKARSHRIKERELRTWTGPDFRFLSGLPVHRTLTFVQVGRHHSHDLAPAMVRFVRHLESARRPRNPSDWTKVHALVKMLAYSAGLHCQDILDRGEAFLKGCPIGWDDLFYTHIESRLWRVDEALDGLRSAPLRVDGQPFTIGEVMNRLSLRQWINLGERFHKITREHEEDTHARLLATDQLYRQTHQDLMAHCQWSACLRAPHWTHESLRAHELRHFTDTREEGMRMDHCVGNGEYAIGCAEGHWRLLSLRDANTDAPVSTVQLDWDPAQSKIIVRQHLGPSGAPAPKEAVQALRMLLRSDQMIPGPWPLNRKVQQLRKGLELLEFKIFKTHEDHTLLGQRLWNEVRRRFPHLIPAGASF